MERLTIQPRTDWQAKVEALGLTYHTTASEPYWDESVCYRFTAAEIDRLEAATNELHRICIEAAGHVIDRKLYPQFGIPESFVPLIVNSWEREDLSLHGRFDLRYDGIGDPKMYEYNADTPTSLLEASVAQWYWLEEVQPMQSKADQFNSIHEKLIARWKESGVEGTVHFACAGNHAEDAANTRYMQDVATQAGIETKFLTMAQIGWDGRCFVDLHRERIVTLFKLYPWEWMMDEPFAQYLPQEPWKVVEPAWKMILSSKAILPVLWSFSPDIRICSRPSSPPSRWATATCENRCVAARAPTSCCACRAGKWRPAANTGTRAMFTSKSVCRRTWAGTSRSSAHGSRKTRRRESASGRATSQSRKTQAASSRTTLCRRFFYRGLTRII